MSSDGNRSDAGGWCCPPMDLMRSEPMQLVQVIIPVESSRIAVSYLGDLGLLQFKDLNKDKTPFQRTYANQIKRCGEMARRLRFFKDQMAKAGISSSTLPDVVETPSDFDDLEVKLGELEAELTEINANNEKLQITYNELLEYILVLRKAGEFFFTAQNSAVTHQKIEEHRTADGSIETPLLAQDMLNDSKQINLGFVSGLVPKGKSIAFERILFRATRGNMFLKQSSIEDLVTNPVSGEKVAKNVFVVFYSGERAKAKILKICEVFGANLYPFTEDLEKQKKMNEEISGKIKELKITIDLGLARRDKLLKNISYQFEQWNNLARKEKAVYHTLNMFSYDVTKKCLVAEGWSPIFASAQIKNVLLKAKVDSNSQIGSIFQVLTTKESPPTYFQTNKFTTAFQDIVDAYGVAKYQEANPGVYTIITFPFLFAVMFGDWGHGICLLIATLYFVLKENKLSTQKLGDITEMIFGGRYVILMMALSSIYTGFIYNEFFSVPFEIFGKSAYACADVSCSDATTQGLVKVRPTYPFGVDPEWHGSRTELPFLNSLKMKLSILLGVAQMNLGIMMSYFNGSFFKNSLNIWYQFVPQMIFLNSLFGYLSLLIIMKWCTGSKADLYHIMIYMFLSPTDDLDENQLFNGQKSLQLVLLSLALISVPWMLFPKPLLLKKQHEERHQGQAYAMLQTTDSNTIQIEQDQTFNDHEEFEFSEIFVHQLIHTIEFVLGAVSNTASYLRLWALSLAHSELSSVFYEKVLILAWGYNNYAILAIGFIVFLCATIGVLLVMETLSAFLHALRLHWVEFQNKFYEGDGYKFAPFSFVSIPNEED